MDDDPFVNIGGLREVWAKPPGRNWFRRLCRHYHPVVVAGWVWGLCGCLQSTAIPRTREIISPFPRDLTVGVAPGLNLTGANDFDPNGFAELMALELSRVKGIKVIPVSRIRAVLSNHGWDSVRSPSHAIDIAESVGAQAILVFAVTHYDPYNPPTIAVSAQLYGAPSFPFASSSDSGVGSHSQSRRASDFPTIQDVSLLAQSQKVFDASSESVVNELREYAASSGTMDKPYGWKEYLVNQQKFIKFCCYATLKNLFYN